MKSVNIGNGNYINLQLIISVIRTDTSPFKKLKKEKQAKGFLIDCCGGKKARSAIIMSSGQVVLSMLQAETVMQRIENKTTH